MKIIQTTCRFCGIETGYRAEFSDRYPDELFEQKKAEIMSQNLDTRCDNCTNIHGSWKQMEEQYSNLASQDYDEFLRYMKESEYKLSKFEKDFEKEKEKFHPKRDENNGII